MQSGASCVASYCALSQINLPTYHADQVVDLLRMHGADDYVYAGRAQSKCPMYVNKKVWEANRTEMGMVHQSYVGATEAVEQLSGIAALTTLRCMQPSICVQRLALFVCHEEGRCSH